MGWPLVLLTVSAATDEPLNPFTGGSSAHTFNGAFTNNGTITSAGGLEINRLDASGGVVVRSPSETARGNFGIYDLDRKLITLVGGVQLNRFCASGLEAVNQAAQKVRSGWDELVIAGGVAMLVALVGTPVPCPRNDGGGSAATRASG